MSNDEASSLLRNFGKVFLLDDRNIGSCTVFDVLLFLPRQLNR